RQLEDRCKNRLARKNVVCRSRHNDGGSSGQPADRGKIEILILVGPPMRKNYEAVGLRMRGDKFLRTRNGKARSYLRNTYDRSDLAAVGRLARRVPAVVIVAPDNAVSGRGQIPAPRQIGHVILNQARPPAADIETWQDFDFVTFHINRQKIEASAATCFGQNTVLGSGRDSDYVFRGGPRRYAFAVERTQRPCNVKR